MKAFRREFVVFSVAFAALASTSPCVLAQPNIVGRFNGFCQNNLLPAVQRGPSRFDVTAQRFGRFLATLTIPGDLEPSVFECDGSVFIGGYLTGSGREAADGDFIFLAGRTRLLGDGSVRVASMLFSVFSSTGDFMNTGILLFVQLQGGPNWQTPGALEPDASGQWLGRYAPRDVSGGSLELDLRQGLNPDQLLTTALDGVFQMGDVFLPAVQSTENLAFDGLGTVGIPAVQFGGGAPFGLIGLLQPPPDGGSGGNNGIIAILIGLLLPAVQDQVPAVQGNYRLYNSLQDAFVDVVFERNSSFQGGVFKVIKSPTGG